MPTSLPPKDVLSTFDDAHVRLLREGATIIPRAATAAGWLVESNVLANAGRAGSTGLSQR